MWWELTLAFPLRPILKYVICGMSISVLAFRLLFPTTLNGKCCAQEQGICRRICRRRYTACQRFPFEHRRTVFRYVFYWSCGQLYILKPILNLALSLLVKPAPAQAGVVGFLFFCHTGVRLYPIIYIIDSESRVIVNHFVIMKILNNQTISLVRTFPLTLVNTLFTI